MAVYFKFKSAKDSDFVSCDGNSISLAHLKDKIVGKKNLSKGSDYDLVISNAQTNEEYKDEEYLVPKNTSVLVRRVPRPTVPIVVKEKASLELLPVNNGLQSSELPQKSAPHFSALDDIDDFGIHTCAVPEVILAPVASLSEENEDDKIRAFVNNSAIEWQRQIQENLAKKNRYSSNGRGDNDRRFENTPHLGYVCHRCGVAGHYIQHCPTNGDPMFDKKKVRLPTGIPKTMLVPDSDGTYFLPTGEVASLKPNEAVFEREVDFLPSSARKIFDFPPDLRCPLCKDVLKNAVLTSKCCFKSYCDQCIRTEIISKDKCFCGATNILADDLLPNRSLRDAITRLESEVSSITSSGNFSTITSSGNAAIRSSVPGVESSRCKRAKLRSPAVSDSLKEASSAWVESENSNIEQNQQSTSGRQGPKPQNARGTRLAIKLTGALDPVKQGVEEVVDDSAQSQPKESTQGVVSSARPVAADTELKDQAHTLFEPVEAKKTKAKRVRQVDTAHSEGMWSHDRNYTQSHVENCCMHCGSYEHPSWNCNNVNDVMNGPCSFHHPRAIQGPMFRPGSNPQMVEGMHQPMGEGYRMPYYHNPGPYNAYGPSPYEFQFNGPIVSTTYGPPQHMQWDYSHPAHECW